MIRARVMFNEGIVSEGTFKDHEELTEYIIKQSPNIKTLEIDIESSDNNRPAFWSQE